MSTALRFIIEEENTPQFNMATDAWLFATAHTREDIVIRFYGWKPAAVSLGCMQDPQTTLAPASLKENKVAHIKRITGGRAIYHCEDLTYSVSFSHAHTQLCTTIKETYSLIAKCLCKGLEYGKVHTHFHDKELDPRTVRSNMKLPCFLAPNRNEIMIDNKKLIGSAQKRGAHGVLQHGSIPLSMAFADLPQFLQITNEEKAAQIKLLQSSCTCIYASAPTLTRTKLIELLIQGFTDTLSLPQKFEMWSTQEKSEITAHG